MNFGVPLIKVYTLPLSLVYFTVTDHDEVYSPLRQYILRLQYVHTESYSTVSTCLMCTCSLPMKEVGKITIIAHKLGHIPRRLNASVSLNLCLQFN